jgi:hypothetical protein
MDVMAAQPEPGVADAVGITADDGPEIRGIGDVVLDPLQPEHDPLPPGARWHDEVT